MNKHLNIFRTYTKEDRDNQLENDLTRALAVCMQEDTLFLDKIIKKVIGKKEYKTLFGVEREDSMFNIEIQQRVSSIEGDIRKIFAVSVSGKEMNIEEFFNHKRDKQKNRITDLYISIQDIAIIFEVKPNNIDCAKQLYQQAYDAVNSETDFNEMVIPVDLSWGKVMMILEEARNFQNAIGLQPRILNDFKDFIRTHNFRWLPKAPLNDLRLPDDRNMVVDRIKTIFKNSSNYSTLSSRLGFELNINWANELLFDLTNDGLMVKLYPANTKGQGWHVFRDNNEPKFKNSIHIHGKEYIIKKELHFKLTSFQKYFAGFNVPYNSDSFNKECLTRKVFKDAAGRKYRSENWSNFENFLDSNFNQSFKWREKLDWEGIENSGKTRFDFCYGYFLSFFIPFSVIKELDYEKNGLSAIVNFFDECVGECEKLLN